MSNFGFFGNQNKNPGGGGYTTGGFQGGPFSASVGQGHDRFGRTGPQTFSGNANFVDPKAGSFNMGVSKTPSYGGSASVGGSVNLHQTPTSNLSASGSHTEHFDRNWNNVGQSNNVGLKYENQDTSVGVGVTRNEPKYGKDSTNVVFEVEKKF